MTKHKQTIHKISEYFSADENQQKLRQELEQDPDSSEIFSRVDLFWTRLFPKPPGNSERISYLTFNKIDQNKKSRGLVLWNFTKYAAIILLIFSVGAVSYFLLNKENTPDLVTVSSGTGQVKSVDLPDGSKAWLNAQSKISFPESFNDKREVQIEGEVYFEIEHDKQKTFTVYSKLVNIQVYGTRFMVSTYNEDPDVSTCLFEGSIAMEIPGIQKTLALTPGEVVTVEKSTMNISKETAATEGLNKWISGGISFYNESLSEIAKKLERKFGVEVSVQGSQIQAMKLTADFEGETLDQILTYMCSYSGLKYAKTKKGYRITLN
ncbi:MAG: FecR family protein [Draconibacterium sp.]